MQMARSLVSLAIALAVAGCGDTAPAESPGRLTNSPASPVGSAPSSGAAPEASPSGDLEQLIAQAIRQPVNLSDLGPGLGRAEPDLKAYLRQASGVAELLGPDGAAILAGFDVAEREAVAAAVSAMGVQAATPRAEDPAADTAATWSPQVTARLASVITRAPAGGAGAPPGDPLAGLAGAFILTTSAPSMLAGLERGTNGNHDAPAVTESRTTNRGETVRTTRLVTLIGSKLTFEIEIDISVGGSMPYTEHTTGRVTVNLCPDANGTVPLELSLGAGSSLLGGGMQFSVTVKATGHVDESGRRASTDIESTGSLATQPLTGNSALGTAPMFLEMTYAQSVGMSASGTTTTSSLSSRASSQVNGAYASNAVSMIMLGRLAAFGAMSQAEDKWTSGYCLAINVPEITGSPKQVDPGSETPFTAVVSHKFETAQLHVPVTATLASGTVSVTPSGTKVPSPASFRYKAPGELDKTAAVQLETRSKRGIATLNVEFRTGISAYRAFWQDRNTTWSGVVCGLDRPFTITVVSVDTTGGTDLTMLFEFAPSGPAGGTVSFDVTKFGTHWKGAGPYEVKAADTGQLNLVGQIQGSYTAAGQTGYYPIPFTVPLTPLTTNGCATP